MITANELIEAAKAAAGVPSNYRLAKVLGVTENTVANWKHGRTAPDDQMAVRLAEMAHLDPADVLPAMYALRTSDPALRSVWARVSDRLTREGATMGIFLAVILSALFGFDGGPDAGALAFAPIALANLPGMGCILCKLQNGQAAMKPRACRNKLPLPTSQLNLANACKLSLPTGARWNPGLRFVTSYLRHPVARD